MLFFLPTLTEEEKLSDLPAATNSNGKHDRARGTCWHQAKHSHAVSPLILDNPLRSFSHSTDKETKADCS